MSLLVLAFPKLNSIDFEWIQSHRAIHDQYLFQVVDPHFTIVFPIEGKPEPEFLKAVENCSGVFKKIEFEINKAIMHEDPMTGKFLEFLVPEKGNPEIVKLHDMFYAGGFKNYLRADLPFIPHITIGNYENFDECSHSVNQVNALNLQIPGSIDELKIVSFEKNKIIPVKTIRLE